MREPAKAVIPAKAGKGVYSQPFLGASKAWRMCTDAAGSQMSSSSPVVLFFNVNGSGMGHLSRCLSYARRLEPQATPFFFSLASAMEMVEQFGFAGDYFISPFWTSSNTFNWNSELALRFGLLLEHIKPAAIVFDGTWPFQGFMHAYQATGQRSALIWSRRGLYGANARQVQVDVSAFDLVLEPGELGSESQQERYENGVRHVAVPPVTMLRTDEFLSREQARQALGLAVDKSYVLLSLGPGNLKRVAGIGQALIELLRAQGFEPVWVQAPISTGTDSLPQGVEALRLFPLAKYMRAFDGFIGAAGYNTCCELAQAGIPALLVPNEQLADDQPRRAQMLAERGPVVVSSCTTEEEQKQAMEQLIRLIKVQSDASALPLALNGAECAAKLILQQVARFG